MSGQVAEVSNSNTQNDYPLCSFRSVRLRIVVMVMFGLIVQGMMKTNLSMAIVCMVPSTSSSPKPTTSTGTNTNDHCPAMRNESGKAYNGELHWTNMEQTLVLDAFYWGGLVSVLAVSYLSAKFGPGRILLIGTVLNILGSFATPVVAARLGPYALLVIRVIMGLGQGVLLPTAAAVVAPWFPAVEKSTASAIYTAGNQISTIISMYLSAMLCQSHFLNGWPAIFYVFGVIGTIFCVLWVLLVSDTPEKHSGISERERKYICGNRKGKVELPTPWRKILTSLVVWAMILCTCAQSLITVSLTTFLPKYFHAVLKMDISSNGILSAAPFLIQLISKFIFGAVADFIKARLGRSSPFVRDLVTKLFNSIASFGAAVCILIVGFLGCQDQAWSVVLFCGSMGLLSGYIPGYFTSLLNVAPAYTAPVNALTRIGGQIFSIISPYVIGVIAKDNTPGEWRLVFILIAVVLIITGLFFDIFGSAEVQEWGKFPEQQRTDQPPPYESGIVAGKLPV